MFLQVKIVEEAPPVIACPRSYNLTLESGQDYAQLRFNGDSHPVEVITGTREWQAVYSPEHAELHADQYVNVTVMVTDSNNRSTSCAFQVFVLPVPCSDAAFSSPDNGFTDCKTRPDGKVLSK